MMSWVTTAKTPLQQIQTLMNLYGGGFRLYCWASFFSLFILISLNRASASNKAEDTQNPQRQPKIGSLSKQSPPLWERLKVGTVLEDFADAGPLVLAASVSLHVRKDSALVGPEVVPGTKEEDGELPDLVPKVLDVGGDVPGMVDLCRPPPEEDTAQSEPCRLAQLWTRALLLSLTCTFLVSPR